MLLEESVFLHMRHVLQDVDKSHFEVVYTGSTLALYSQSLLIMQCTLFIVERPRLFKDKPIKTLSSRCKDYCFIPGLEFCQLKRSRVQGCIQD